MDFLQANEPFIVSALIIALGYLLKRAGILKESDGETLAKVALNVTLPAIILINVPKVHLDGANAVMPLLAFLISGLTVLIGLLIFRKQKNLDKGLSLMASSGYNVGLFAMPLVAGVYGAAGIARFALVDIGNIVMVLVIAYYLAYHYSPLREDSSGSLKTIALMFVRSIPFVACIIAVGMNLLQFQLTGFAASILEVPAAMNQGVALITLGILLRFRFPEGTWKAILPPLLLRYIYGVIVAALILFLLPLPLENRVSLAGVVVMPMGLSLIPYAVRWGYDRNRAAAIINMGIPVSFVLFWTVWLIGRLLES